MMGFAMHFLPIRLPRLRLLNVSANGFHINFKYDFVSFGVGLALNIKDKLLCIANMLNSVSFDLFPTLEVSKGISTFSFGRYYDCLCDECV